MAPSTQQDSTKDQTLFPGAMMISQTADESASIAAKTTTSATTDIVPMVTPQDGETTDADEEQEQKTTTAESPARRSLFPSSSSEKKKSSLVSPSPPSKRRKATEPSSDDLSDAPPPASKRKLIFGKYEYMDRTTQCTPNVIQTYKIVRKLTGSIGGNGYCGPIYGELTMGSMQKITDLMIKHTALDTTSRFIDVGSGIGKPNLHVAQYPGVAFSCGVEMEHARWSLGMTCLKAVLDEAVKEDNDNVDVAAETKIQGNTMFLHKNIMEAKTFNPFTHVYMFSIGFPPPLWIHLSEMWNKSQSPYLICYHGPRNIIDKYEFDVELVAQTTTSMHGSSEGHMGYIYQRKSSSSSTPPPTPVKVKTTTKKKGVVATKRRSLRSDEACDEVFRKSWDLVRQGVKPLHSEVNRQLQELIGSGRRTRSSKGGASHSL